MGPHLGHIILKKNSLKRSLFHKWIVWPPSPHCKNLFTLFTVPLKMMCTISQYSICFQRSWGDLDCSAQRFVQNCYHSYRYVFIGAHPLFEPLASTGWPAQIIIICATSLDNVFSHSFKASSGSSPPPNSHLHSQVNISAQESAWEELYRSHYISGAQLLKKSWTELSLLQTQNNAIFLAGAQDLPLWLHLWGSQFATLPSLPKQRAATQVCISDWFRLVLVEKRVIKDCYSLVVYTVHQKM